MLPDWIKTYSPILRPYSKLLHLTSGSSYGDIIETDDHIMRRLNDFVTNCSNEKAYQIRDQMINVPFPSLTREKLEEPQRPSDIMMSDTNRQHMSIEERYRKGMMTLDGIRQLNDGATRVHWAMSRGYERRLISQINKLDAEMVSRKTMVPVV